MATILKFKMATIQILLVISPALILYNDGTVHIVLGMINIKYS